MVGLKSKILNFKGAQIPGKIISLFFSNLCSSIVITNPKSFQENAVMGKFLMQTRSVSAKRRNACLF